MKNNPYFVLKKANMNINAKIKCAPRWKKRSNFDTLIDFNSDVRPAANVTRKILAIFEPTTFPTEMSGDPLITASIETTSSQSEVPKPTTINPIKNSETLSFLPIAIALDISISAPFTKSKSPIKSVNMLNSILLSKISQVKI